MTRQRLIAFTMLAATLASAAGCHGAGRRPSSSQVEPALSGLDSEDRAYLDAPTAQSTSVVDRHPMLYKPREYWENSGDNKIVKAAAATFVGVPVGVAGEVRQIFTGPPKASVASGPSTDVIH